MKIKASGATAKLLFMPCFRNDRVLAGEAQVSYFTRTAYPRTEGGNLPGVALQDRGPFGARQAGR